MFNGGKKNQPMEKSKNFGAAARRLFRELRGAKILVILAIIFSVGGSVLTILAPNKIATLTDEISKGLFGPIDINAVWAATIFMILLYGGAGLFELAEGLTMAQASNGFAKELRKRISRKINRLPLKFFDKNQTGDILSRVTNDIDTIAQSLDNSLATLTSETSIMIGVVIMMFITNWTMALVAVGASILGFIGVGAILGKSQKYFGMRQKELGKLNAHIEEIYSGLLVVNGKAESDKKFDRLNKRVYTANLRSQFLSGIMPPIMIFIGNLGYVAVCVTGALLVTNNAITFGTIMAFIIYVRLFTSPLSRVAQSMASLQAAAAASDRVFDFLDEDEMSNQNEIETHIQKGKIRGDIEFDHVRFGYDPDKTIINDFSAEAKAGQKIAIVGPTGAGKTTMVNLLMKFYELQDGDIRIDGVSTRRMTREDVHSLFTMVLQDTWMFAGTLRDNIVYNRKGVSDDEIMKICKTVGLEHFVKTLPKGLSSEINESDSISAGQKQLITIARGMVEDAPFLILDEATSNVDTRTEELVQKAMDKLMQGRTSFIIAHRLSTIRNADLILVMNEGNIIESGSHAQLMKENGFYAELYNSQFAL